MGCLARSSLAREQPMQLLRNEEKIQPLTAFVSERLEEYSDTKDRMEAQT